MRVLRLEGGTGRAEAGRRGPRREAPDCPAPPSARPRGFLVTQRGGEGAGVGLVPDGLRRPSCPALSAAGGPPGVGGAQAGPQWPAPRDCAAPLGSGAQGLGAR